MGSKANYTLVGLFVIVLITAGISIFMWMQLHKHNQQYKSYVVYLSEQVNGLNVDSVVRFNGVPVGYVRSIALVPSNPQLVQVVIEVAVQTPINASTYATLTTQGITGVEFLGLKSKQVNAPPLVAKPGQRYPVIPSQPSLFMQLSEVLPEITKKITELSDSISQVFDDHNREAFADSLNNMRYFTRALRDNSARMSASMASLQQILKQGEQVSHQLPDLIAQSKAAMQSINQTSRQFNHTAVTATAALHDGQLTMNLVSQQLMPSVQTTLQQLNTIAVNLTQLTNTLKRNPSVLVRGKAPAPLGPGE